MDRLKFRIFHLLRKLYWFIVRPQTKGVKGVVVFKNKVLMLKRTLPNSKWVFPGGAIKLNESYPQALARKVAEDTGLEIEGIKDIGEFTTEILHRSETIYCFKAVTKNDQTNIEKSRIQEIKWFDIDAMPNPLSEVSQKVFDLYCLANKH